MSFSCPHTLYILRHGQTDWNAERRFQGQRDTPLNGLGREQAQRNGEALAQAGVDPAALAFVASPLARARETMEILRAALGLAPETYETDPRLAELSYGTWEGMTLHEISTAHVEEWNAREADKWRTPPPEGESYADGEIRARAFLEELSKDTLIVAHGGMQRVFRALLEDIPRPDAAILDIPQDRIYRWAAGKGGWL
ncbi:histidine phosphatase family protein [Tepidicaulis sp. LMO-SS28]|uniref:histidine phosphatase family protein n=1 Tax=Tepidicaulis sp. LMO-SS28 TaxID=3447455 RepID=UPI003EE3C695